MINTCSITKVYKLSYGHLLVNHKGNCRRVHGHNAKIEVTITGPIWPIDGESASGMVLDFGDLKTMVEATIGRWDHRFLAQGEEWPFVAAPDYEREDDFILLGFPTTAENLAREVFIRLQRECAVRGGEFGIQSIRWWETDDSYAEYLGEIGSE